MGQWIWKSRGQTVTCGLAEKVGASSSSCGVHAGKPVVRVAPYNTAQRSCGVKVPKHPSGRGHECAHCDLVLHRDHNTVLNIQYRSFLGTPMPGAPSWPGAPQGDIAGCIRGKTVCLTA